MLEMDKGMWAKVAREMSKPRAAWPESVRQAMGLPPVEVEVRIKALLEAEFGECAEVDRVALAVSALIESYRADSAQEGQ
jgi:hypothetical protein